MDTRADETLTQPAPASPPRHGAFPLVGAHPLAHRVVAHPVLAPDRTPARRGHLRDELLIRRPLHPPRTRDRSSGRGPSACRRRASSSAGAQSSAGTSCRSAGTPDPRATPVLAPAMRVERRRAVRADDPEVLEPVVVGDAVDVVEDQRHPPPVPLLALPAELARARLEPVVVEPLLELPALVRRAARRGSPRAAIGARAARRRRADEVVGRDVPLVEPAAQQPVIAAGGAQPEVA